MGCHLAEACLKKKNLWPHATKPVLSTNKKNPLTNVVLILTEIYRDFTFCWHVGEQLSVRYESNKSDIVHVIVHNGKYELSKFTQLCPYKGHIQGGNLA